LVFLKLIFKNLKFIEIIIYNLIFTALSIYFISIVHLQVTIIFILILILFYSLNKNKDTKFFVTRSFIFISIFLLTNSYMIFNTFFSLKSHTANTSVVPIGEIEYYKTVSNLDFIFLGFNRVVNDTQGLPIIIKNDDLFYQLTYILFIVLILYSTYAILRNIYQSLIKKNETFDFFSTGIFFSVLIVGYLQTISLTEVGAKIYIFATKYIHILGGLRNYINKVPSTYALVLITFVLITYIKFLKKSNLIKFIFILSIFLFTISSLKELVYTKDREYMLPEGYKRYDKFDEETIELLNFLESDKKIQRTAFFPLSEGPYDIILNKKLNGFYLGMSPSFSFLGIDSINAIYYIEGGNFLYESFAKEKFLDMSPERILFKLKILGVDKIIFNNEIDLKNFTVWSYSKTDKYDFLKQELQKNYTLDFETSNKKFSVYDLDNNLIQFKKYNYKLENNSNFDFYSLNYEDSTFSFDTLPNQYFNFFTSLNKNVNADSFDKYSDEYSLAVNLKEITPSESYIFNKTQKIYHFNSTKDNLLRIVLSSPKNFVTVRAAIAGQSSGCIKRVFDVTKNCEMFKDILPQNINNNYVYTVKFEESFPGNMYVLFRNNNPDEFNTEDIKPIFYSGDSSEIKYNPFSLDERNKYLKNYFEKNNQSLEYQIPKKIESSRFSTDTYKIKVELDDRKSPLILILKNLYSEDWIVEGSFIENQIKFKSDNIFNGWVIQPNGKTDTLELTVKLKESKYSWIMKEINRNMVLLSIIIFCAYGVYFIFKKIKSKKNNLFINKG